ncbi:Acyl-CoA carboxylase epsilon subunit, partial [Streptomyces sp. DvalAA-14]
MSGAGSPQPGPPVVRFERGDPDPAELAAVTAVL